MTSSLSIAKVEFDISRLPTFEDLNTAHWPSDQQVQFATVVSGIRSMEWLRAAAPGADENARERIARSFAFAALSELRRRMRLAPDEALMRDEPGRSAKHTSEAQK
jgi:hypothetical protein